MASIIEDTVAASGVTDDADAAACDVVGAADVVGMFHLILILIIFI